MFALPGAGHVLRQGILLGAVPIAVSYSVNLASVLAGLAVRLMLDRRPA